MLRSAGRLLAVGAAAGLLLGSTVVLVLGGASEGALALAALPVAWVVGIPAGVVVQAVNMVVVLPLARWFDLRIIRYLLIPIPVVGAYPWLVVGSFDDDAAPYVVSILLGGAALIAWWLGPWCLRPEASAPSRISTA